MRVPEVNLVYRMICMCCPPNTQDKSGLISTKSLPNPPFSNFQYDLFINFFSKDTSRSNPSKSAIFVVSVPLFS